MAKQVLFGDNAREKILSGMKTVADSVTVTMGPKGRNVILEKSFQAPLVTNDGVTIAKEIELEGKFENMGAKLVIEAAEKTNSQAGDGTTTATLLTYNIAREGLRYIKSGVNSVELKNGLRKVGEKVVEELEKNSKKINSKEEIAQVATISAQNKEVGEIIAEAMEKVGKNGVISVEEGQTFGLEVEITEGMEFDSGYLSPYMISDPEKMISEIKNAPILLTDAKISNMKDLLPILEQLMQAGKKDLVIIADDVDGEALTTIILNKLKGVLNVLAIKAPGFGDNKKELLKDIAVLTGANIISSELAMKLENASLEDLGEAGKIIASKDKTTIVDGKGDKKEIEFRIEQIKNAIENSSSDFSKKDLEKRLAKLAGGVAVIKVGAVSEVEMKELKLRIEDALNATRAAVEEGIVAGGGTGLLKASKILDDLETNSNEEELAKNILKEALVAPIRKIAENAGKDAGVIINKIEENSNINYGYDALKDEFVDMIEAGIIDPKKVERVALQEAISLAGMFLTTEAAISEIAKKEDSNCPDGNCGIPQMPMM